VYKYSISLIPVVMAGGPEHLEEGKRAIFEGVIQLLAALFKTAPEISECTVRQDYSLLIVAKEDVFDLLKSKINSNCVLARVD
jgi:hypothetical protein